MTRRRPPEQNEHVKLTKRQYEAATLAARSRTVEEIADAMGVSPSAAKQHLARVRILLGVARSRDVHDKLAALEERGRVEVV